MTFFGSTFDPFPAAFDFKSALVAESLEAALEAATAFGGRNLWRAVEHGICPAAGVWGEGTVMQPPEGMHTMWERALDLIYPLIGIGPDRFADECERYYENLRVPEAAAWADRDPAEVADTLARALAALREVP